MAEGKTEDEAKKTAPLMLETQEMLQKWEQGDEETIALWLSWFYLCDVYLFHQEAGCRLWPM
jgi:arginyl-tRNA synthetase